MVKKSRFLTALLLASLLVSPVWAKRNFKEVIDDTIIASKLRLSYMKDKLVDAQDIKIKVLDGVVTLEGYVDTQDQINRAIELAEKANGVHEVNAYLVLHEFGTLREVHQQKTKAPKISKPKKTKTQLGGKKTDLQEVDLSDGSETKEKSETKSKSATKNESHLEQTDSASTNVSNQKSILPPIVTPQENNHGDEIEPSSVGAATPPKTNQKKDDKPKTTGKTAEDDFKEFDGY